MSEADDHAVSQPQMGKRLNSCHGWALSLALSAVGAGLIAIPSAGLLRVMAALVAFVASLSAVAYVAIGERKRHNKGVKPELIWAAVYYRWITGYLALARKPPTGRRGATLLG